MAKVNIIQSDLVGGEEVPRPKVDWEYEGNPQTPTLSDGNVYTYHPVGINGPQLVGHDDTQDARQTESDEAWVSTNSPDSKLANAKAQKIDELRNEATTRVENILGIPNEAPNWLAQMVVRVLQIVDNSYTRDGSLDPDAITLNGIRTAFVNARTTINGYTLLADVQNYDPVNDPLWP